MAILRTAWPRSRWPAFNELDRMRQDFDRVIAGLTGGLTREREAGVFPLTNVTEDKNNYYVRAELPGIKAEELDISVTGDSLSISGERKIPTEQKGAKYHRREREAGKFSRMIALPGQIDTEKAQATCIDGILTLTLPKAEAAKPKQISVKSG